jgi:glycosyltransferase involved in cell wall biosynthesis
MEAELRSRVANSPARDNIQVEGFVENIQPLIERSSVFLLVSRVEGGVSMATLEAMTNGLVPVVTDAGDAHLLSTHSCGVVSDSFEPASIAESVVELFREPRRLAALRSNALNFAARRSVHDMVGETLEFFDYVKHQVELRAA